MRRRAVTEVFTQRCNVRPDACYGIRQRTLAAVELLAPVMHLGRVQRIYPTRVGRCVVRGVVCGLIGHDGFPEGGGNFTNAPDASDVRRAPDIAGHSGGPQLEDGNAAIMLARLAMPGPA
jgi:hypothetical protein